MSGGIITVLLALWERHRKQIISSKWYAAILAFFVLLSMFLAWRDERQKVETVKRDLDSVRHELEAKSKPELQGEIQILNWGLFHRAEEDSPIITAFMTIKNLGAPSAVEKWAMFIDFPDGKSVRGVAAGFSHDTIMTLKDGSPRVLRAADRLDEKLASNPIPQGGRAPGFIMFVFEGFTRGDLKGKGNKLRVEYSDVTGRRYTIVWDMARLADLPMRPGTSPNLPGISVDPPDRMQQ